MPGIKYRLSFPNRLTHFIYIEMEIDNVESGELELIIPDWRPGRYELTNYVSNIKNFQAYSSDRSNLVFVKTARNKWLVKSGNKKNVIIQYSYWASKMDAGSSVIDEDQIYINFINCMLYSPSRAKDQIEVFLDIPENYDSTCSLEMAPGNLYRAENYFELVDSPFLASETLKRLTYTSFEKEFNIFVQGSCPIESDRIIEGFKKFTDCQIGQMNGFPSNRFDFIIQSLPYRHYHGVEHRNSTVLVLGPNGSEDKEKYYENLMGVASHELFHAWNVTRIRPKELSPYDFSGENYYETGFVTEGFTTYYGDLFLARSAIFDEKQYLKELNVIFKRHFENYGRHHLSLVDSSFDLWIDGYKKLLPGRKVSIYVKGAIIAFMLDLTIRKFSDNKRSLDNLMNELWENYGKVEKGYSKQDIYGLIKKYTGSNADSFIESYYEGVLAVEGELGQLLEYIGCKLVAKDHPEESAALFGFKTEVQNGMLAVIEIAPRSFAEMHLSIGDKILEVNKKVIGGNGLKAIQLKGTILIERNNQKKAIQLSPDDRRYYQLYEITKNESASKAKRENFDLWVNGN